MLRSRARGACDPRSLSSALARGRAVSRRKRGWERCCLRSRLDCQVRLYNAIIREGEAGGDPARPALEAAAIAPAAPALEGPGEGEEEPRPDAAVAGSPGGPGGDRDPPPGLPPPVGDAYWEEEMHRRFGRADAPALARPLEACEPETAGGGGAEGGEPTGVRVERRPRRHPLSGGCPRSLG